MTTYPILSREETLRQLPDEYPDNAQSQIARILTTTSPNRLVVLDDDPTGTQTSHDISVLTVWDLPTLITEFDELSSPGFFILTNSRALPPVEAERLIREICHNVALAAKATRQNVDIVLRSDSTMRGHFPLEVDVAQKVMGDVDAWVLAPFFYQGGRLTINDVHYVVEGDRLVPVGSTQFARDATFGYSSSNLKDYVLEKAPGRFTSEQLFSVSIDEIRTGGPDGVCDKLCGLPRGSVVVVNAAAESDMHVFVAGLLLAESKGKRFLPRTGAAFVSTRLGIRPKPPISARELNLPTPRRTGGLIIAGSYVPKTTTQLDILTSRLAGPKEEEEEEEDKRLSVVEVSVTQLLSSQETALRVIQHAIQETDTQLKNGKDTLLMTSRELVTGDDELSSLAIGATVAEALVRISRGIEVRPRYIIAKGGITSSDTATKGLGIKRALVVGQAAPGVPLWRCEEQTCRHRGVPFVVFPGNVGGDDTLFDLVEAWR